MRLNRNRIMDRVEQVIALALYAYLVGKIWPHDLQLSNLAPALILLSEGVIVFFLVIRRPTENVSLRFQDWAVALLGTTAPLLVTKAVEPAFIGVGVFMILFGMVVQISAKLSLRRSFGLVAANRGVKTSGMYRYVRHPMYLGYIISHVGFLFIAPLPWNFAVYAFGWTCLVIRVLMEERLLSQDARYQQFMEKVRYRLVPGVY